MGSKFKPSEAIETILEALRSDGLRRLCDKREIVYGRSDADRRERLAGEYRRALPALVADLRRADLIAALGNVTFEVGGKDYELGRLHKATLSELLSAANGVFISDWEPRGEGDGPVGGGPIDTYRVDDGWADEDEDNNSEDGNVDLTTSFDVLDEEIGDLFRDLDEDAERPETLPSHERINPAASSPQGRHDASLTDFQLEAIAALDRHFARPGARGLLCLPTGGGKTRTSLDWLLNRFVARGSRVLWVTHRVDLLDQVHEEIRGLGWLLRGSRPGGFTVSRYQGRHDDLSGDIVLASAATLARREPSRKEMSRGTNLGIVVYDEAHRAVAEGTWRALSTLLGRQEVPFLGLTATPFRTERGGTAKIEADLGGPVYQRTFKDLIDVGFLAKPVFVRQQLRSTSGFVLRNHERAEILNKQELTPGVLGRLAREPRRNQEILEHWLRERQTFGKTLAFACNVEHADSMAKLFRGHQVRADSLHSGLAPQDRAKRLAAFRDGQLEVLVNVGILTEGANVPDTKTVLMARPTMSTSLYMQMIGRGARGPLAVPGKTQFYVIDCVDNFGQHGLPLAGPEVASRLSSDPVAPRPSRPRLRAPAEERAERRELATAAAWLVARGYDPRSYSFWGELRWESTSGPASVAVFTETYAPVEDAVRLAQDAVASGRWELARSRGPSLESLGALRAVDWARVIADCQKSRFAPQLVPVPDLKLSTEDLETAVQIQRLAQVLRGQGFDAAMVASDELWAASDAIRGRWASPMELRQEVMSAASTQVHAASAPAAAVQPPRVDGLDAFVEVALAVARADGTVDDSERLSILRGAERLLAATRPDIGNAVQVVLASKEDSSTLDTTRGLSLMRQAFDWSSRLVSFDLLFRVALADGRLAEEERLLLEQCAVGLELPREELTDRLQWFHSTQPAPIAPVIVGFRTCPSCSATFEGMPNYCVYCGTSMTATR